MGLNSFAKERYFQTKVGGSKLRKSFYQLPAANSTGNTTSFL